MYGCRSNTGQLPIKCSVSCDDGWFHIIDVLSALIVDYYPDAIAILIKEKYGTLRFHLANYPKEDYLLGLINMVDSLSEITCEKCGNKFYNKELFTKHNKTNCKYKKDALDYDRNLSKYLKKEILGPVNAPIFKINKKFRCRLLLRVPKRNIIQKQLNSCIDKIKLNSGIKLTVDVDPISFN